MDICKAEPQLRLPYKTNTEPGYQSSENRAMIANQPLFYSCNGVLVILLSVKQIL